jgi:hypothetical protein
MKKRGQTPREAVEGKSQIKPTKRRTLRDLQPRGGTHAIRGGVGKRLTPDPC